MLVGHEKQQERGFGALAALEKLLEVTQSLIAVQDLGSLLQKIAESAGSVLGADAIVLYEYSEGAGDVIVPPVIWGTIWHPEVQMERNRIRPHRQSAVFKVLERTQPFYASNAIEDWTQLIERWPQGKAGPDSFVHREGILSSAAVPLIGGGERVGVLFVNYRTLCAFHDQERRIIETFATLAAIAINNARLFSRTQKQVEQLTSLRDDLERQIKRHQILHKVGTQLAGILSEKHVMSIVASAAAETLNCTHCSVFRLEKGKLVIEAVKGNWEKALQKGRTFKLGQGVAGWVAQIGQSALVPNTSEDRRFESGWAKPHFEDPKSLVVVPILLDDNKIYGVISVEQDQIDAFDKYDLQLVETLSQQAAQTVRNARLFATMQQLNTQLESLHRVVQEQSLERILDQTIESINVILGDGTSSSINLYDEKADSFSPSRALGPLKALLEVPPRPDGTGRYVLETRQPLYLPDVRNPPSGCPTVRNESIRPGIRSFAALPLKRQEQIVGVLFVNLQKAISFSEEIKRVLELFASHAAISIENARLYEQRAKDIAALQEIDEAVVSKGRDEISQLVVEKAVEVMSGEYSELWLIEPATSDLVLEAAWGPAKEVAQKIGRLRKDGKPNINIQVASTGQPHMCEDVEKETAFHRIFEAAHSSVTVPLEYQGRVIGTLNVESSRLNAFTNRHCQLLSSVADQAAVAIENARLYKDLQRRVKDLDTLNQVGAQLSMSLDRQEILQTIVEAAHTALGATRCILFILDDDGVLVPRATAGAPPDMPSEHRFQLGEGLAGWVAQARQAYLVHDTTKDPRFVRGEKPSTSRSMVLAPLWVEGKVIGVISATQEEIDVFDEQDVQFLDTLAVQAGIAINQQNQHHQRVEAVKRRFNPYVVGEPIRDPNGFFGRRQLIQDIFDRIPNNNIIIYGERRIGKTSLLFQLGHHLVIASVEDRLYHFLPVFASLQGIAEDQFFDFLVSQVARAAAIPLGTSATWEDDITYSHYDFEYALEKIIRLSCKRYPDKKVCIVLLLDEMDQFVHYAPGIHNRFRSLFSAPSGAFSNLKMIMAGVSVQRMQQQRTSPWYNLFKEIELPPLDKMAARQLVVEPVQGYYTFENDAIETILEYSDLKPQEVQNLSSLSVNAMLDRISEASQEAVPAVIAILRKDVLRAVELALQQKDGEYSNLWLHFSHKQHQILLKAMERNGLVDTTATDPHGSSLLSREDLYNIASFGGQQVHLTRMFVEWLRRSCP